MSNIEFYIIIYHHLNVFVMSDGMMMDQMNFASNAIILGNFYLANKVNKALIM